MLRPRIASRQPPNRSCLSLVLQDHLERTSFAAFPNVSYAFITSSRAKRCVTSLLGCNLPEPTTFSSIGVVTVSTSLVVSVMLRSQSFSTWSSTGLPWTPVVAVRGEVAKAHVGMRDP